MFTEDRLLLPAWLITFTTYGTWLHGDPRGSVDRNHNAQGRPYLRQSPDRHQRQMQRMVGPAFALGPRERAVVEVAIREVCQYRNWTLQSLHIRTKHLHSVVLGDATGMKMLADFKAYSTRRLIREGLVAPDWRVWTRGGSARFIRTVQELENVCRYVEEEQGSPLPSWNNEERPIHPSADGIKDEPEGRTGQ